MPWHKPKNLNDWMGIILRHKKKFFFPALIAMTAVIWFSRWIPREYFAEAKFQRINDSALSQMGGNTNMQNLSTIRRQLNEDIKGRTAVEQIINDLQLTSDLPHTPDGQLTKEGQMAMYDKVRSLTSRIGVYFQVSSEAVDQIVVTCVDPSPDVAPKIVNQVVENYIRKTRQQLDEMLLNAKTFFEREVARYRARITELGSKKLRFELDNPGLVPDDPASIQSRLVELRTKLDAISQDLAVAAQKRTKLQEFIKDQPEFLERRSRDQNPVLTEILKRKSALESELEMHKSAGRTLEHPVVKKILVRITELDKQIASTESVVESVKELEPNVARIGTQQEIEMLSGTIAALERKQQELNSQVEQYEIMNRNFFVVRSQYMQIDREMTEAGEQLNFWDENLRRTSIALTAEVGQRGVRLSILQRAPELAKPTKPTLIGIISAAVAAGLGAGAVMVLLAEILDHSYHSVDQAIDGLKLPVLGAVNEIITPSTALRQRVYSWGVYPAVSLACILILLVSLTLTYYNLQNPLRYEQLVHKPGEFIKQTLFGS